MRGRRGPVAAVALAAATLLVTAGCTAAPVDPQRSRTVVVTVDVPFESLNAATTAGRTPGSTLVRGLVQDRFTTVDQAGAVVPDTAIGTVQKVSDDPLTVRYTIAPTARWSDGVPVTGDDLLLEWAARSGQLDEAPPAGATASSGQGATAVPSSTATATPTSVAPAPTSTAGATVSSGPGATASSGPGSVPAADTVWFGAVSPVLVHAPALPTVDAHGLTLVYADPVADWQTALDVNLPAHVVGRLALGGSAAGTASATPGTATTTPTGVASSASAPAGTAAGSGPSTAPSTGPADAARWASLVTTAIQHGDRAALIPISQTWRTAEDAQALHADPAEAVTTGPYRVDVVDPGKRVELVRNEAYAGARPARYDRVVVRSDLDPLSEVAALRSGTADVVAPVATGDVRSALQKVPGVRVAQGGGAVLQLQLQESGGGVFDPTRWASGGDDGRARAAALRTAFVGAVDRARLAALGDGPTSDAVLAQVGPLVVGGPGASPAATATSPSASGSAAPATAAQPASPSTTASPTAAGSAPVPVRVLVSTDDQVRRDMLGALTQQLASAGFAVTQARPTDPATALWADPGSWDVALVPVPQSTAPVASVVARWHSGGATDVTGHRDPRLDALLDAAARQTDPAALTSALAGIAASLSASDVVVPVVRQPVVTATVGSASAGRPRLPEVPAIPWGAVDLASWWAWASTGT